MSDYRVNLSEVIFFPSSFSNLEKYVSRYKTTRPIRHANLTTYVHVASTQARKHAPSHPTHTESKIHRQQITCLK